MPDNDHDHQQLSHHDHHSTDPSRLSSDTLIDHIRSHIATEPLANLEKATLLRELGSLLRDKFNASKELTYLNEAVEVHRQSLIIFEDPHDRHQPGFYTHYGFVLHDRFHHSHDICDINDAVLQHQTELVLLEDGDHNKFHILCNLSKTLRCRFDAVGKKSDLHCAILYSRRAVDLQPQDYTGHDNLARCLDKRVRLAYHEDSDACLNSDLNELFEVRERELDLTSTAHYKPGELHNHIGTTFYELFGETHLLHALDKAISIFRKSLNIPHIVLGEEIQVLINLSACLHERYVELKQPADRVEAEELSRRALEYSGPLATDVRRFIITTHCKILRTQYDESGRISNLNEIVALVHEFLSSPESHAISHDARASLLLLLGSALQDRFLKSGTTNMNALEDCVKFLQEARDLASTDNTRMTATHSLVGALLLQRHAGVLGEEYTIQKVIQLQEEVVNGNSGWPDSAKSVSMSMLGRAWHEQYLKTRTMADLDESIKYQRKSIELSQRHRSGYQSLSNLALYLHRRYLQINRLEDLDEAIEKCGEAVSSIEEPHPDLCIIQATLGRLLTERFLHTNKRECLQEAVDAYRTAASNKIASTPQRFFAAQRWAGIAQQHDHESAMEAYSLAISLLPRLAVLGIDLSARMRILTAGTDGLAREAAKYAINAGLFEKAVEFLEEGRAIFWSQALQLRTPLEELRNSPAPGPQLADKLHSISKRLELESLSTAKIKSGDLSHEDQFHTEKQAAELQKLDEQWQACVKEVHLLPGFDKFLLPKSYSELQGASSDGPVVILTIVGSSADALILRSEKIVHVPLPSFTPNVIQMLREFGGSIRGSTEYASRSRSTTTAPRGLDLFARRSLAALWRSVVHPIIRALDLKKSVFPDRIWWCPTGVFVSMPIHAAGIYGVPNEECLADYAVSSYIPTLTTLLSAVSQPALKVPELKMLTVIQSETRGYSTLHWTKDELKNIQRIVPSDSLVSYGLEDAAPATVDTVLRQIPSANVVHFACHGKQDAKNPLDSALVLEDGLLKVPQIMQLSIKTGSLVFLSACQTATGDQSLPDEVIHLATTMLFAGFRGAVGTMWSIRDEDGPIVADNFYQYLFTPTSSSDASERSDSNTVDAARALHVAVAKLRGQGRSFMSWVPFIHFGY